MLHQIDVNGYPNRMLDEINVKRDLMMQSAEKTGLTSKETIYYSQELDKLIYEYQRTFRNKSKQTKSIDGYFHQLVWPTVPLKSKILYS
ncbi:Spo0E family sporulation regulatory protein-aspartic acid phosphatase [Pseudoneobacillus sp. C159]